jgi:DNA-dependent RNA polymerase
MNTNIKIEWCDNFIKDMKKEFDKYYISNFNTKEVEVLSRDKMGNTGMNESNFVGHNLTELDFDFYFLNKYLDNADEPFQFILVYYAIKDIIIKKQYNITIPILFDAIRRSSGVQHLASIASDIKIAGMVNVVDTKQGRSDFYQIAADYVINTINNMELNNEIKEKLKLIKVTRSILKIPIMTISYNVGLAKMSKNLLDEMGKLVVIDNLINTENRDDININLPIDSNELETTKIPIKSVSGEKEKRLKKNYENKTFKIKINKEHSKTEEDLILDPKD